MTKRVLIAAIAGLVLAAGAVLVLAGDDGDEGVRVLGPPQEETADALGAQVMENIRRGHVAGRSAEVFLVPKPHFYLAGDWDLTTIGTDTPWTSTAHPNPWRYIAHVPLIFYGPGYIPSGEVIYDRVDLGNIAPTYARILGVRGLEAQAEPLDEIAARAPRPPKVIFSVVVDGGGWNALQAHPDSWPNIARIEDGGTSYVNASTGSAPSITGAIHATIGTGVYPIKHGLPGNQMRAPDGENVDTWLEDADGRYLEAPTVSELWDEQNNNKPTVGTISYEGWHLGMIGKGALRAGADKDIAALWRFEEAEDEGEEPEVVEEWWINERYYELPRALRRTNLARLERYEEQLDGRDGLTDGTWFGNTLEELQIPKTRPGTPAFVRFTGDAVIDTMRETKLGDDAITDLFWVEMKMPDFAGHAWNVEFPEEADVLFETDRQIGRFIAELDRTVGKGNYIFMISADHGQQPLPDLHGGWRINTDELEHDVRAEFGDIVEKVTTVDIFMDMDAVESRGIDLDEVARWLTTYTISDNIPPQRPGSDRVPRSRRDETLFAAAFSTEYLQSLTPEETTAFGDSEYEQGSLTIENPSGG